MEQSKLCMQFLNQHFIIENLNIYKSKKNSVMSPLSTFNNYELQQLLTYGLLCFTLLPSLLGTFFYPLLFLSKPHSSCHFFH